MEFTIGRMIGSGLIDCIAIALTVIFIGTGCSFESDDPSVGIIYSAAGVPVSRAILSQADSESFDYMRFVGEAEAGSLDALKAILLFTGRLTEGPLIAHGIVLVEILPRIGDQVFAEAISRLDIDERESVQVTLNLGISNVKRSILRQPLERSFPVTYSALTSRR